MLNHLRPEEMKYGMASNPGSPGKDNSRQIKKKVVLRDVEYHILGCSPVNPWLESTFWRRGATPYA